jgi:site-specific recombinase XerD
MSMSNQTAIQTASDGIGSEQLEVIISTVCNAVQSQHTRRAYARALRDFMAWYQEQHQPSLSKAVVQSYLAERRAEGMGVGSYNQARSAIMRLVREAVDNQALSSEIATGIEHISSLKRNGVRMGNWLSKEQAELLIKIPDVSTLKGLRDRAILALLIGTGIRRTELTSLTFEHLAQREGRWVIVDMLGKGDKIRSVPMPSWCKGTIDAWAQSAGISSGLIFRAINKGDRIAGDSITAQAIYYLCEQYSREAFGEDGIIQPHDLRRTFAHLSRSGGAQIEQISLALGHASITTTERYLGTKLDLVDAACDRLNLHINGF